MSLNILPLCVFYERLAAVLLGDVFGADFGVMLGRLPGVFRCLWECLVRERTWGIVLGMC